jgi:hypothetical protein
MNSNKVAAFLPAGPPKLIQFLRGPLYYRTTMQAYITQNPANLSTGAQISQLPLAVSLMLDVLVLMMECKMNFIFNGITLYSTEDEQFYPKFSAYNWKV